MCKKLRRVPQFVRLQSVDRQILLLQTFSETLDVNRLQETETLSLQSKEALERALHGVAINKHRANFNLQAFLKGTKE